MSLPDIEISMSSYYFSFFFGNRFRNAWWAKPKRRFSGCEKSTFTLTTQFCNLPNSHTQNPPL